METVWGIYQQHWGLDRYRKLCVMRVMACIHNFILKGVRLRIDDPNFWRRIEQVSVVLRCDWPHSLEADQAYIDEYYGVFEKEACNRRWLRFLHWQLLADTLMPDRAYFAEGCREYFLSFFPDVGWYVRHRRRQRLAKHVRRFSCLVLNLECDAMYVDAILAL